MPVLGFNYTKLDAEKMEPVQGKVSINNNVSLTEVEEQDISADGKTALSIDFRYQSEYKPDVAEITIEGNMVYLSDDYDGEELAGEWEENQSLPDDAMRDVLNKVLNKCNVEAIVLSRDLNLPAPFKLPTVEKGDSE